METAKKDKFMKELISRETIEAVTDLKKIIKEKDCLPEDKDEYNNVKNLVKLCLQQSKDTKNGSCKEDNNNFLTRDDIISIIKCVLKNNLDFNHRLEGTRNVLELWQKTRASKNEEMSIKLREKGNDQLRIGHLNESLALYNEALLHGNQLGIKFLCIVRM